MPTTVRSISTIWSIGRFDAVSYSKDENDRLSPITADFPLGSKFPHDFAQIVTKLCPVEEDIVITKRQWVTFYGTELDLQLRRRKIDTILLGGIATKFGVESSLQHMMLTNVDTTKFLLKMQ